LQNVPCKKCQVASDSYSVGRDYNYHYQL
jgi:hypothetical protein